MKRLLLFIAVCCLTFAGYGQGMKYFYQSGTYTTAGSWKTSGSVAATAFTNATDTFVINTATPPTLNAAWTVAGTLQIGDSTGTTYATVLETVATVSLGGCIVYSGETFTLTGLPTITGAGIYVFNGGTLNVNVAGSPTLVATQGTSSTISYGAGASHVLPAITFGNLTLSDAGVAFTMGGAVTVAGTLTFTNGTLTILAGNTLTLNGAVSGMSATKFFTGSATSNLTLGSSSAIGTLFFGAAGLPNTLKSFVMTGGGTATLGNSMTDTLLDLTSTGSGGILAFASGSNATLGLGRTFNTSATQYITADASTNINVTSISPTAGTLYFNTGAHTLNTLTINGAGGVTTLGNNITVTTLALTSATGTIADGGNVLTVTGNITGTGKHLSSGSGYIYMTSSSPQTISGMTATGNMQLNNTTGYVAGVACYSLTGSPSVNGLLTFTSGNLAISNNTLTIATNGSVTGMSKYNCFTGSATSNITISATSSVGTLFFDTATIGTTNNIATMSLTGAGAACTLGTGDNLSVSTTLNLGASTTINDNGDTINVSGSITGTGTNSTPGNGEILMTGATKNISGITPGNLEIDPGTGNHITMLTTSLTTNGKLIFGGGALSLGGLTLTIGTGTTISGMSTSNYITGSAASNLTIAASVAAGTLFFDQTTPGTATTQGTSDNIATFTINSGSSVTLGSNMSISTSLALSGSIADGGKIIKDNGIIAGTGTHTSTSGGAISMIGTNQSISGAILGNVTLGPAAAATYSLTGSPTITGALTFAGLGATNALIIGANTLTLNGTVSGMSGTQYFTGGATSNITVGASGALGNIFLNQTTLGTTNKIATFIMSGGGTATLGNSMTSGTLLDLTATGSGGTLAIASGSNTLTLAGTFNTGATQYISPDGSSLINVSSASATAGTLYTSPSTFTSLNVSNATGVATLGNSITVGALALTGTLQDGGYTITVTGNVTGAGKHTGAGIIDMTGSGATLSALALPGNLEIDPGTGNSISLNGSLITNGTFLFGGGSLSIGNHTLTLASGTALSGMSTSNYLTGGGTSLLTISEGGSVGTLFFDQSTGTSNNISTFLMTGGGNVTLGTGSNLTVITALTLNTLSGGQIAVGAGNTLTISGTFTGTALSGYITGNSSANLITGAASTYYFDETSPGTSNTFASITVNSVSVTTTLGAGSALSVGNLALNGILADGGNVVTVTGNITGTGTHSGTGGIVMNGGSPQSISGITTGKMQLNNSTGFTLTGSPTINGAVTFTSGKLAIGSNTLTIATGGSVASMSAANSFTSNGASNFTVSSTGATGTLFFDLTSGTTDSIATFTQSGTGTTTLGNNVKIGTLALNAGTVADGGNTVTVAGNITSTGASGFGAHSGTGMIIMTGSGATLAGITTGNLEFNNAGGFSLTGNPSVTGTLTFNAGNLAIGPHTLVIPVGGNVANMSPTSCLTGSSSSNFTVSSTASIGPVYFDQTSTGTGSNSLNAFTVSAAGGRVTLGAFPDPITITTLALTMATDTLADSGNVITVTGNISGLGRHIGSGYIYMNTGGQSISGLAGTGNLQLNNASGFSLSGSPSVTGLLTFTSGNLQILGNTLTIAPGGSVTGMSTTNCFTGGSTSNLTISATSSVGTLFFDPTTPGTTNNISTFSLTAGGGTCTLGTLNNLSVSTTLNIGVATDTIYDNGDSIIVSGNVTGLGANTTPGNGEILMTGPGKSITGIKPGNLEIDPGTGNFISLGGAFTTNGKLIFEGGSLSLGAFTLTIGPGTTLSGMSLASNYFTGNGTTSGLSITDTSFIGTLYFDPTTPGTTNRLGTLTLNAPGVQATLGDTLQINTTLALTNGTLYDGGTTITLLGSITGTGTYISNTGGQITMTGANSKSISGATLGNLTLYDASAAAFSLSGSPTINGILNFEGVGNTLTLGTQTLTLNGTVTGMSSSQYFTGIATSNIIINSTSPVGTLYFNQASNKIGTFQVTGGSYATLGNAMSAGTSLNLTSGSGGYLVVDSLLTVTGSFTGSPANYISSGAGASLSAGAGTYYFDQTTPGTTNSFASITIPTVGVTTALGNNVVAGNLALTGTLADGGNTMSVTGNITGAGIHTGTGEILMDGSTPQNISNITTGNLQLNNSGGFVPGTGSFILTGTPILSGNIIFTSGNLAIGANTLTFNGSSTVTGMSATNCLTGNGVNSNLSITSTGITETFYFDPSTPGTSDNIATFSVNGTNNNVHLGNNMSIATALALTSLSDTLFDEGHTITLAGNITGGGTHVSTGSTGRISMTGANSHSISGATLGNVSFNSPSPLAFTLSGSPTINGILKFRLTGNTLTIGAFTLKLNGTVQDMSSSNYITGSLTSNITVGSSGALGTLFFNETTPGTTNKILTFIDSSGSATFGNAVNISTLNLTSGSSGGGKVTVDSLLTIVTSFSGGPTNYLTGSLGAGLVTSATGAGTYYFDQTNPGSPYNPGGLSDNFDTVTISGTAIDAVTLGSNVQIRALNLPGKLIDNGDTAFVTGSITGAGNHTTTLLTAGEIDMTGNGGTISNITPGNLEIHPGIGDSVGLAGNLTTNGQFLFSGGYFFLNGHNLTIGVGSSMSGLSAVSNFFSGNGTGALIFTDTGINLGNIYFNLAAPGTTNAISTLTMNGVRDTVTIADSMQIGTALNLTTGVLYDGGNRIVLQGNITGTATHISNTSTGRISMTGATGSISGATLGNISLNSTTATNFTLSGSPSIYGALRFKGAGNTLTIGANTLKLYDSVTGMSSSQYFTGGATSNITVGSPGPLGTLFFNENPVVGVNNKILTFIDSSGSVTFGNAVNITALNLTAGSTGGGGPVTVDSLLTLTGAFSGSLTNYLTGSAGAGLTTSTANTVYFDQTTPGTSDNFATVTVSASTLTLGTNVQVGNLTLTGAAGTLKDNGDTAFVTGNITGTGIHSSTGLTQWGEIEMMGSAPQNLSGITTGNIQLNSATPYNYLVGGVPSFSLTGTPTVNDTLTFTSGNLALNQFTLTFGVGSSLSGMSLNNCFTGNGVSSGLSVTDPGVTDTFYFDEFNPGTTNQLNVLTVNGAGAGAYISDSMQVNTTLTLTNGTLYDGGNKVTLHGNIAGAAAGTHISSTGGRIHMDGLNKTIAGVTLGNLTLDYLSGVSVYSLTGSPTINGALKLKGTSNDLAIGAFTLKLNGTVSMNSDSAQYLVGGATSNISVGATGPLGTLFFKETTPGTTNKIVTFIDSSGSATFGNSVNISNLKLTLGSSGGGTVAVDSTLTIVTTFSGSPANYITGSLGAGLVTSATTADTFYFDQTNPGSSYNPTGLSDHFDTVTANTAATALGSNVHIRGLKLTGTLNDGGDTAFVTGNITGAGIHSSDTSGEIDLIGSSTQNLSNFTTGNLQFNSATGYVAGASCFSLTGTPIVNDTLIFTSGNLAINNFTLTLGAGTYVTGMSANNCFTGNGASSNLTVNNGANDTLYFDASTPLTTDNIATLNINGGSNVILGTSNNMSILNALQLTSGTLFDNGDTVTLEGNITGTGTHISSDSGMIMMTGTNKSIAGVTLGNLMLNSPADTLNADTLKGSPTIAGALTFAGSNNSLTIGAGNTLTLDSSVNGMSGSNQYFTGSLTSNMHIFTNSNIGTLYFDQSLPATTNGNIATFTLNGSNDTVTLGSDLYVNNTLALSSSTGVINDNGQDIHVSGNITGSGTHISGLSGQIIMTGTNKSISGVTLGNVKLNDGAASVYSLTGSPTIYGYLSFASASNSISIGANTLTLYGPVSGMNAASKYFTGSSVVTSNLIIGTPGAVGTLFFNPGSAGNKNNFGTFAVTGGGTVTLGNTLYLDTALALDSGTAVAGADTIYLAGNIVGASTETSTTGPIIMNASGAATISGATVGNLTLDNPANTSLTGNPTVTGKLMLSGAALNIGSQNLTLGTAATFIGAPSTTNMIYSTGTGSLNKQFSGTGSFTYPIGDATPIYSPITLNFTGGTFVTGSYTGVTVTNSKDPNNTDATNYLNRYWTVNTNIASPVYKVTGATYAAGDVTGTESSMILGDWAGSLPWIDVAGSSVNIGTHTISGTGTITNAAAQITGLNGANPTVVITSPTGGFICGGLPAELDATPSGDTPFTYVWSPSTGLSATTGATVYLTLSDTVTTAYVYSVTATDADGLSGMNTYTLTVYNTPYMHSIGNNGPICAGNTLTLSSNAYYGTGPLTYTWNGPNTFVSGEADTFILNATTLATGIYTLSATDAHGCVATGTNTTTATVNPVPAMTSISNSGPICAGLTLDLSSAASGGMGTLNYHWHGPNSFNSTNENDSITSATILANGTYTVVVTDSNSCTATGTNTTAATVYPNPIISAISNNGPICSGTTLDLTTTATGGTGPLAYAWNGPNTFSSTLADPTIVAATTLASGTYTLTVTDAHSCYAVGTNTTTATVNNAPAITSISNNGPICAGSTLDVSSTVTGGTGTLIYAWSGPNSFTSTNQNDSITAATTLATGIYTLTVTDSISCHATGTNTMTATVNPVATITSIGNNGPVCAGATLDLTSVVTGGGSPVYAWNGPSGFTSTLSNPTIGAATTLATGIYTLTVTDGTCAAIGVNTTTATVNPTPTITAIGNNGPVCAGTTLDVTSAASGGTGTLNYAWNGPNSFTSTNENDSITSVTTLANGTYTLTVTDANSCNATGTNTTAATINATPVITSVSNSGPICAGGFLTLSSSSTGAGTLTYAWDGPNSFTSAAADTFIIDATTLASGTYTFTVTNASACYAVGTTTVTVNGAPTLTSANNSGPVCAGSTLNLTVAGASDVSAYSWSGPVAITNPDSASASVPSATTGATGVYTVTVSNGSGTGCTASYTTTATVNPSPAITSISNNGPICPGSTLTLSSAASGGTGALGYAWNGPNSFTSTNENDSITSATSLASGIYTLTVTDANSCHATGTNTTTATIYTPPAIASISNNGPLCAGATLVVSSTVSGGFGTDLYSWNGPNSFTSTNENDSVTSATTLASGTYTLSVTDGHGCSATGTNTTAATVNPAPSLTSANNDGPLCVGGTLNLTVTGASDVTGYLWNGPVAITSSTSASASVPSAGLGAAGTYTVTVNNGSGTGCTANYTTTATVNPDPSLDSASNNGPVCAGTTLSLTADGASNVTGYLWTGPVAITTPASASASVPAATTGATGTYTVTVNNGSGSGCTANYTTVATVNAGPSITSIGNSGPICAGSTLDLTSAASGTGSLTYSWTGPVAITDATSADASVPSASTAANGNYTLTVTDASSCQAVDTTTAIVNASPTVTSIGNNGPVCAGSTLTLSSTASGGSGTISYSWSGPDGFTSTNENDSVTSATTLASGLYTLSVTATGCTGTGTNTTTAVVNPDPSITAIGNNGPVCAGATLDVTSAASGGTGSLNYAWNGPNSFTSTNENDSVTSATTLASGTYTLTVTDANSCYATGANTTAATVNPDPSLTSANNDGPVCAGATLNLTVTGASNVTGYLWNGPVAITSSTSASASVPGATTGATGTYTVTVNNGAGAGCTANYTTAATVNPDPSLTSANNDGPVCAGATLNLTVTGASNVTGYLWNGPVAITSSTSASASVPGAATSATGTYTVTVNNGAGAGCTASYTTTATVNPDPTLASANNDGPICAGATLNLTVSGASNVTGYLWNGPVAITSSTSASASVPGASTSATGTYTVTVNNGSGTGCTANYTTAATVNPAPMLTSANNSGPVCAGTTLNLTVTGASNVTGYLWNGPVAITSSTSASASVPGATTGATGTYTVTVNNGIGTGCTANYTTAAVVNPSPSITSIGNNGPICSGSTLDLTSAASGGTGSLSYSWTGPVAITTPTSADASVPGATTSATGTYILTVTDINSCQTVDSTSATVNSAASISAIGNNTPICAGTTLDLTSTASGGVGPFSYTWNGPNSFTSTLQNPTIPASTTLATGTYTLTLTASGCVGSATGTTTATVTPSPAITAIGNNGPICAGNTLDLTSTASGGTGGLTYSWTGPVAITGATSADATVPSASTAASGIYTLTVTDASSCSATGTNTTTATVNPLPAITAIGNNGPVCAGTTLNLTSTASGGTGTLNYAWIGPNTFTSTLQNASITSVTTLASGTYTLSVTDVNSCAATGTNTTSATVNPTPSAGVITGAGGVCVGSSTTLSDTAAGGVWSSNSIYATVNSTSGLVTGVAISAAVISYSVTNLYSCTSVATYPFNVIGDAGYTYTQAGTGTAGYTGDGGAANLAEINTPKDLVADTAGNLYFCDLANNVIRKVSTEGIITTVVGTGVAGNTGDGGPATAATLNGPNGVFVDVAGNIYIANTGSSTIRKVNGATGIITTIAGTGTQGFSGDGGAATAAKLHSPLGLCTDSAGNVYIADQTNYRVRKITVSTGIISTIAGNGSSSGYAGDGGQATAALLSGVRGIRIDLWNNMYIDDAGNNVIRKVNLSTGIISPFAGHFETYGSSGDGGPATAALFNVPARIAYDGANLLYVADAQNNKIREINISSGIITTVAGTGSMGSSGDGGPSTAATFNQPAGVACDYFGNMFVSDANNNKVRLASTKGSIAIILANVSTTVTSGSPVSFTAYGSILNDETYQWQKNGTNVGTGATTYTDPSPSNGDVYTCLLAVDPDCGADFTDTSNAITITVTGGRANNDTSAAPMNGATLKGSFSIYPNPVSESLHIDATDIDNGPVEINIYDQLGRVVINQTAVANNNQLAELVNMHSIPSGVYVVSVTDNSGQNVIFRLVKN